MFDKYITFGQSVVESVLPKWKIADFLVFAQTEADLLIADIQDDVFTLTDSIHTFETNMTG